MSAACAAGSGFGTVWSTTNQPPTATAPSPSSSSARRPGVPRSTRSCVVLAFSRRSDWPTAGAGPGPRACSPVILAVEGRLRVRASELAVGAEYDVDEGSVRPRRPRCRRPPLVEPADRRARGPARALRATPTRWVARRRRGAPSGRRVARGPAATAAYRPTPPPVQVFRSWSSPAGSTTNVAVPVEARDAAACDDLGSTRIERTDARGPKPMTSSLARSPGRSSVRIAPRRANQQRECAEPDRTPRLMFATSHVNPQSTRGLPPHSRT